MEEGISVEDRVILDSPFYTHRKGDGVVWLGVMTPYGALALPFQVDEWRGWLAEELEMSQPVKLSSAWEGWE